MYKNIHYDKTKNEIHVWDDKYGKLKVPYKKYAYIKTPRGKFTALDGEKVEKIYAWSKDDEMSGNMYESDVPAYIRYLVDTYYESDDISENVRELYLDIEVAKEGKHSSSMDANNTITAIALFDKFNNEKYVLLLDIEHRVSEDYRPGCKLLRFDNEMSLLQTFYDIYMEISPDILTHWNGDDYDIPYIYNRTKKILGGNYAKLLSPVGVITYDKYHNRFNIAGVSSLDYMLLYKKFSQNEEPSYALEAISQKELGRGKIKYEGTLDDLFRDDLEKFIEYNLNDVDLIIDLDKKLGFIDLARNIAHKGHVMYEDALTSVQTLDGACLTYLKRLDMIAPNRLSGSDDSESNTDDNGEETGAKFDGAYVKDPIPGLYDWVFDEDLKALYPSCQRTLNMSPETKICRLETWDVDSFINDYEDFIYKFKHKSWKGTELRKFLVEKNYAISAIGVIYNLNHKGLVPSILESFDTERDEYRALAKKFGAAGNEKMYRFYDSRQLSMKILANSLYGVLGNKGFRFYDLDGAESTTLSGQAVIKHKMLVCNNWFVSKTKVDKDYVLYVDTDSVFLSAQPLIEMMENQFSRKLTYDECSDFTFKLSVTIENHVNSTFAEFALRNFNATTHYFKTKQEYVSETAFWIKKKRYAQKIISEKGTLISTLTNGKDQFKLDVKGMDVVRSSFPKAFKTFMSGILVDILNKAEMSDITDKIYKLKDELPNYPILDIATTASVKEISKYPIIDTGGMFRTRPKGMPVHVKAAANYNDVLDYSKDESRPKVVDGDKIKWCYLKSNPYGIETLGMTGYNDPDCIMDIIKNYIDYEQIFQSGLINKLNAFYAARGWGEVPDNNMIQNFFSFD